MDQMQWLMKKIVFSSSHIVQGVKFVNLHVSYLWKELVSNVQLLLNLKCFLNIECLKV